MLVYWNKFAWPTVTCYSTYRVSMDVRYVFFSCFVVRFHDDGDGDDDGASASLTQWSAVKNHEQ